MAFLEMWAGWVWVAGAALGIMTTLVAIVYALSEFLMNEKMKSWAKTEFAEIFYSALIISMIVAGVPLINQVVKVSLLGASGSSALTSTYVLSTDAGLYGAYNTKQYTYLDICGDGIASNPQSIYNGVDACHMRLGIWFMNELFNEGKQFAFDTYLNYIGSSVISEFTINIEFMFEKAGFFTFTPWRGFFTIPNKVKEMVFDWVVKIMMVIQFQEVLLHFIAIALFPSLIVIGGVLRTFAFTRRLGGLLLAMALALYFIFPSFYAVGALIMLDMKNDKTVQSEWLSNTDANPGQNPDPPIVNTMYISGDLPMPGSSTGKYSYQDAEDQLNKMQGMTSDQIMQMNNGNPCDSDPASRLLPCIDLNSHAYDSATDAQKQNTMESNYNKTETWLGVVSRTSKFDQFISFAWSKNGPLDVAANFTFWAMTFSLFGLLASIAAIRSLSITFGGDIEIAGLTRLI
jgi:hypothetical protein